MHDARLVRMDGYARPKVGKPADQKSKFFWGGGGDFTNGWQH